MKTTGHEHNSNESCDIETLLKSYGLIRTKDRHGIIALFWQGTPLTASDLHHNAHHSSRSTVYRNLELLEKKGLVQPIGKRDGETLYEWVGEEHHDHETCGECETTVCIPCPAPKLPEHKLELKTLCASCK